MPKPQPETKIRRCKACGESYQYPSKGVNASRFHCVHCLALPKEVRVIFERLTRRISGLEKQLDLATKTNREEE